MSSRAEYTDFRPKTTMPITHVPEFDTKIIGSFSVDYESHFTPDTSECKYVYNKYLLSDPVEFDLNDGIDDVILKPEISQNEKLDYMLKYILLNRNCVGDGDVVCSRGLLRELMCVPYEENDSMTLLATKFKGVIYMCSQRSDEQVRKEQNYGHFEAARTRRILSYGLMFEHFMLTSKYLYRIDFVIRGHLLSTYLSKGEGRLEPG